MGMGMDFQSLLGLVLMEILEETTLVEVVVVQLEVAGEAVLVLLGFRHKVVFRQEAAQHLPVEMEAMEAAEVVVPLL
jgi:hypothetical protein